MSPLSILKGEINRLGFVSGEKISLLSHFTENVEKIAVAVSCLDDFDTDEDKRTYLRYLISPSELLTEQELFRTVLPLPILHPNTTTTNALSSSRKVPNDPLKSWDFLTYDFNASLNLNSNIRKYNRPKNIESVSASENTTVDWFLRTMEVFNEQRLIDLVRPEKWCRCEFFRQTVKGHPGFIRCSAENTQQLLRCEFTRLLAVAEVKPEWLIRSLLGEEELYMAYNTAVTAVDDSTDVHTKYQKIIRIVRQMFGYMVINDMRFGLLTSYVRTWFFCRQPEDPNNLYISPAVFTDQNHTSVRASFLECMHYFENLSTNSPNNVSRRGKQLKYMKNYKRNQFSFGDVLGSGRSGTVFTAKLFGKTGALKIVDLYKNESLLKEMLNEIEIYRGPLKEIQGIYIPKLLKFGVLHEAFVFIFTSFAELGNKLTKKEKQLAIEGLQAIHIRGIMHGDVRLENIMAKENKLTGKNCVWWIDFALSKIGNVKELDRELFELKRLLGISIENS
ncbi:15261_t:CDS:2 [Acaulospora morrowiae]|uniref:15261_t:CDS:1 n=1 Tax=Acaulospora morrowiae TaxID=94023 RepID=A0A9N9AHV5_9GLOM|nr:15261_t:CDS:2 [Acaulospora morrowiae]